MSAPVIGDVVHYRSYGTPGGEYLPLPRAAIVTAVSSVSVGDTDAQQAQTPDVSLCVLNPTGLFFNEGVAFSEEPKPGHWSWPPVPVQLAEEEPAPRRGSMRAFASQLIAGQNHSDREPVWDMPIVIPEPDPAQFAKLALARSREMAAHEITVEMITDILVELGIWSDRQAGRVSKYASAIVQKVESRLLPAADDAAGLSGKAMSLPVWRAIDALRGSKLLPSEIEAIVAVARSCGI